MAQRRPSLVDGRFDTPAFIGGLQRVSAVLHGALDDWWKSVDGEMCKSLPADEAVGVKLERDA